MNAHPDTLLTNVAYRLDLPGERQRTVKRNLYWFAAVLIGFVALVAFASKYVQYNSTVSTYWLSPFTHSLFESYCALISLIISYVLYREYRASGRRSTFYLLMAFVSMAIFDFAHAYSNHSLALFVWFHTVSAFSGGAFFLGTSVSLRKDCRDPLWRQRLLLLCGFLVVVLSVGQFVYLQPILPDPLMDELSEMKHLMPVTIASLWDFSDTMIVFNIAAAACFLLAGIGFLRSFTRTSDIMYFVFSLASFLFAGSDVLFAFSNLWNITWWYWHVIKLFIFIGLSIGLAHALSRSFSDLYESRRQLRATVDELKRAYDHLQSAQEELLESEKLASIGKMAATISHEIRNPLAAIKNSAGIFKRHAPLSAEDSELLGIIGREIGRLDGFITGFLEFAKPHPLQRTMTDLNGLIDETLALVAHDDSASGSLRIVRSLDPRIAPLFADRNALKQVLWNVLINAVQAMPDGGTLAITTAGDPPAADGTPGTAAVAISDTGGGMPPETVKKAFHPFFSTKTKGTGLGLSIVERVMKQHGGHVSIESAPAQGTTVSLFLPLGEGRSAPTEAIHHAVHPDR